MRAYFAYGANMDVAAMRVRCPASTPLGAARWPDHRFFIMTTGYASVRPEPGLAVHGLLWMLADSDRAALDDYEEVEGGLYRAASACVQFNEESRDALVYLGASTTEGPARPGYLEAVVAAAHRIGLPRDYARSLEALLE